MWMDNTETLYSMKAPFINSLFFAFQCLNAFSVLCQKSTIMNSDSTSLLYLALVFLVVKIKPKFCQHAHAFSCLLLTPGHNICEHVIFLHQSCKIWAISIWAIGFQEKWLKKAVMCTPNCSPCCNVMAWLFKTLSILWSPNSYVAKKIIDHFYVIENWIRDNKQR